MKLLRLKISDPAGFRSLPPDFEHHFRIDWTLQEEMANPDGFAPFVCAGPNGSGKSNLLEALAAIFFQLEVKRVRSSFLPDVLQGEDLDFAPVAFELDYLIQVPPEYRRPDGAAWAKVCVWKNPGESVRFLWENQADFDTDSYEDFKGGHADILLPQYVVGYSSGQNEILSLPFFKLRFVQFDEYSHALTQRLSYPGHPETRLAYLDSSFSQAILLCNLLFHDDATLQPFREDVGVEALSEFRIILRRSIEISPDDAERLGVPIERSQFPTKQAFIDYDSPVQYDADTGRYRLNLLKLLEGDERSSLAVSALKRCATLSYHDSVTDTLILDYWVNDATKVAFRDNFNRSPLELFQAFQVLLALNLYSVSDALKKNLYTSTSHYVSETVPTLASDQRVMRFKHFYFTKRGVAVPMLLKELSDGEYQLLHSLGMCLLFRGTNSLFLLDEPETHFNPDWRANFISRLRQCLSGNKDVAQEMLLTTHTPFVISDSRPGKVLVFKKDKATGVVSIDHPDFNTLGASINKITMSDVFGKRETIGAYAHKKLDELRARFEAGNEEPSALIDGINRELGDSVEKILLIKAILARSHGGATEGQD